MPYLSLRRARLSQPGGDRIDWSNPLTKGMFLCYTPNGGDALGRSVGGANSNGPGSIAVGKPGYCMQTDSSHAIKFGGTMDNVKFGPGISAFAIVQAVGTLATYARIFDTKQASNGFSLWANDGGSGNNRIRVQCSTLNVNHDANVFLTDISKPTAVAAVIGTDRAQLYENGNSLILTNGGDGTVDQVTTNPILIGSSSASSVTAPFAGNVFLAMMWNRSLSDQEVKALSANPWQVFKQTPLFAPHVYTPPMRAVRRARSNQPNGDSVEHACRPTIVFTPSNGICNAVNSKQASIVGTAPTAKHITPGPKGQYIQFHPSGGSSGYGGLRFDAVDNINRDLTIIWCGIPDNLGSGNSNGELVVRGADGSGNGWNVLLQYVNITDLRAYYTDTSPATTSVSISPAGLTAGVVQCVALRKQGASLSIFDLRTRTSSTASGGNAALRTSTVGVGLATATGGGASGHNRCHALIVLPYAATNAEVWALLENPWRAFK